MYEIQNVVSMAETQLLACLSFLLEVGAISLIDMFDVCNIYSLQDFESIWKEDVLTDLYNYSHIRYYPSSLRIDTPRSLGSRGMYEETEEEMIDFSDLRGLLSLFHQNTCILQITEMPAYTKLQHRIDLHRFVVFCCIHRILKRVYVYPHISNDVTSFYLHFNSTLSTRGNPNVQLMPDDNVGMSVDCMGVGKRYEDDEELNLDNRKRNGRGAYRELFSCFHHSLYHISHEKNSLSRHSSCLSMKQELMLSYPCKCNPDPKKVRKMVTEHCCLESIALHNDCCIPSIMRYLETQDDIVFLKE